MKNINTPGVLPLVIALFLTYGAIRAHAHAKAQKNAKAQSSRLLCAVGAVLFYLIALFQVLESFGVSFR